MGAFVVGGAGRGGLVVGEALELWVGGCSSLRRCCGFVLLGSREGDVGGVGPGFDVAIGAGGSGAFDVVEGEERLGLFGFFDEFFEADVAAALASEGVDVVDAVQERGPVEASALPLGFGLGGGLDFVGC